jgi:hypothetical protein
MIPMSQLRRVAMFLVTIVLTAVPVVIGASAPAGAATGDITLTTSTLPAMHAGQTAWVSTLWNGTNKAADNFKAHRDVLVLVRELDPLQQRH